MKKLLSLVLALTLCLGMAVPVCAANRTIHLAPSEWLIMEHPEDCDPEGPESGNAGTVEVSKAGMLLLYGDLERTGTVSSPSSNPLFGGTYDSPIYRSNGPVTVSLNGGLEAGVTDPYSDPDGALILPAYAGIDTMSYDKDTRFYSTLKEDALYFNGKILPENRETEDLLAPVSIREFKEKGMEDSYNAYYYEGASAVLSEPGIYRVYHDVSGLALHLVSAYIYIEKASGSGEQAPSFSDVAANAWYADAVAWAVEKGITNGTGANKFSPNKTCNNSEILTFLWRACGKPEAPAASFSDVASGAWYADAANWAKSKGMVSGDKLSPTEPCTRASAVMYIWQAMGKPSASKAASFTDVSANADYAAAVAWAVEKGVTNGTGADTFSPDTICTRAQIVTFLQRAYAE